MMLKEPKKKKKKKQPKILEFSFKNSDRQHQVVLFGQEKWEGFIFLNSESMAQTL